MTLRKGVAGLLGGIALALGFALVPGAPTTPASAAVVTETMTDRCSREVMISEVYNTQFPPARGLFLKRTGAVYTSWSEWMPVNGHTHIRWWCHSTTGNWLDPGTWRLDGARVEVGCDPVAGTCKLTDGGVSLHTFDVDGWTAERSRCDDDRTRHIRARLGPDRLLQMQCIRP